MCGIVGILNFNHKRVDKNLLSKMQESIKHRGPDGDGQYLHKNVALGMRRLSIIDVKGGDQPLFNEDKSIAIVGNGEIYNYLELQKELIKKGHKLRTKSDIETITHSYEEWGFGFIKKLRGMFAIAMFDKNKNKVIIARDRMGEKPLYYTKIKDDFYFGSEMKTLINLPDFDKTINKKAIDLYFHYYYIPEPLTVFENVKKVSSATYLEIDLNNSKVKEVKYWDPSSIKSSIKSDPTELIKKELQKICELTLRSDVPVGISLSGGIDSGTILALSAPKYKQTMKAFSIGYEGSPLSDEREMAKKLAKDFKVKFIEKEIKTKDVVEHFPQLIWNSDDPIADIASHSIYEVSKLARNNNVKVMLGGNGGDEIFWGYPSTIEGIKNKLRYNNPNPSSTGSFIEALYSKEFSKSKYQSVLKKGNLSPSLTLTNLRNLWLKSNVITLGDRMSMASSVELRSPFLDYKLVELALKSKRNLESYKLGPKHFLKKAMKGILPHEVLERPKKGFTPPVANWISEILKKYKHLLKNGFLIKENILDKSKVSLLLFFSGRIPTYTTYQLLVIELWGRLFVYNEKI